MCIEEKLLGLGLKPIGGQYSPMSFKEIKQLERILGDTLPDDYKNFVSTYGCSYFPNHMVLVRPRRPHRMTSATAAGLNSPRSWVASKAPIIRSCSPPSYCAPECPRRCFLLLRVYGQQVLFGRNRK